MGDVLPDVLIPHLPAVFCGLARRFWSVEPGQGLADASLTPLLEFLGDGGELGQTAVEPDGHPPHRRPTRVVGPLLEPGDLARVDFHPLRQSALCQVGLEPSAPNRPPEPPLRIFPPCHCPEQTR